MKERDIFYLCAFSGVFVMIICIFLTPAVFDPLVTFWIVTSYCLIILLLQIFAYKKELVVVEHNMLNQVAAVSFEPAGFDTVELERRIRAIEIEELEELPPEIVQVYPTIKNRRLYLYFGWEIGFIYRMKRYLRKIEGITSVFVSYREKDFEHVDHLKLVNVKFIYKNQDFSLRCYLHYWDSLAFVLDSRSILVTYEFSDIRKIAFLLYHSLQLNTIILPNQFQILM